MLACQTENYTHRHPLNLEKMRKDEGDKSVYNFFDSFFLFDNFLITDIINYLLIKCLNYGDERRNFFQSETLRRIRLTIGGVECCNSFEKEGFESQAVDESKKNSNFVLKVCINLGVVSSHFYLLTVQINTKLGVPVSDRTV